MRLDEDTIKDWFGQDDLPDLTGLLNDLGDPADLADTAEPAVSTNDVSNMDLDIKLTSTDIKAVVDMFKGEVGTESMDQLSASG